MVCHEQMRRTRGSNIPSSSQDEDGIPDPPPVPPNLADAIAALVNVTIDNARLFQELAQSNQNMMRKFLIWPWFKIVFLPWPFKQNFLPI